MTWLLDLGSWIAQTWNAFPHKQGKQIDVCSKSKFARALVFIESKRQACSFGMKVGEKIVLK